VGHDVGQVPREGSWCWIEVLDSAELDDPNIVELAIVWPTPSFVYMRAAASQYPFSPIICFLPWPGRETDGISRQYQSCSRVNIGNRRT
jgi:hypothetical protein